MKDRTYLIKVARRYFEDGYSQQQIAEEFNVSRPTVSMLLKKCREEGVVDIRISDPDDARNALAAELKAHFPVERVLVAESRHNYQGTIESVGELGAEFIQSLLTPESMLGTSWGETLYQIVHHLPHINLSGATVVQLVGGTGAENPHYDGFDLARSFALRLHGTYRILPVPILVRDDSVRRGLLQERGIAAHQDLLASLTHALVGVSSSSPEHSALVASGYLTRRESQKLASMGVIGNMCGYHFTEDGEFPDIPVNRCIVGITLDNLKKVPLTAAACGKHKAKTLAGAMRTGFIQYVITDEFTALSILEDCRELPLSSRL